MTSFTPCCTIICSLPTDTIIEQNNTNDGMCDELVGGTMLKEPYLPGWGAALIMKEALPGWGLSIAFRIGWPLWLPQMGVIQQRNFWYPTDLVGIWNNSSETWVLAKYQISLGFSHPFLS